jgi:hypothetical protein
MYTFLRTDKRTLTVTDAEGSVVGSLARTKWHGLGAEIIVAKGVFPVRRMPGLTSKVAVFSGDLPVLIAEPTWRGLTITDASGRKPAMKMVRAHIFSGIHHISIADRVVMKLRWRMNWSAFQLDPTIVEGTGDGLDPLTLLFAVYAIQVQQRRATAAAAS